MPVATSFQRAGSDHLEVLHWGWWHLDCFSSAYHKEQPEGPKLSSLYEYTFTQEHSYTDESDGEVLDIHVGDIFRWWRE